MDVHTKLDDSKGYGSRVGKEHQVGDRAVLRGRVNNPPRDLIVSK